MTETLTYQDQSEQNQESNEVLKNDFLVGQKLVEYGFDKLSVDDRLSLLSHANLEDIKSFISFIHGIVAPNAQKEETSFSMKLVDPNTHEVHHVLAKPEERDNNLEKALELIQELISRCESQSDKINCLERSAFILASAITLNHAYLDGNGRTARTVAHYLKEGFDSDDSSSVNDMKIVSSNRPTDGSFRINSFVPKDTWRSENNESASQNVREFLDAVAALDMPLSQVSEYHQRLRPILSTPYNLN